MRFTIDSDILEHDGITMQEFSVLLYYISGGKGILNEEICSALWDKGFLVKDADNYFLDNNKISLIDSWIAMSSVPKNGADRLSVLADKLRALYPDGKKAGTNYYWKDSNKIITQRLAMFFKKYEDKYSDEDIIKATTEYVKSFNADSQYMQLLKYFIYKRGSDSGEESSQLLSYLENAGQEEAINNSWRDSIR